ncbi:exocyst complex component 3 [Nematocida parisii]|nr:exocyst complex component 3 [Nematocida parisii]KAI5153721.1 exocyst complex component 3 [Nematocida parisii]KAI5156166.1 exocyst complex component 3 [Nematocida parisii]
MQNEALQSLIRETEIIKTTLSKIKSHTKQAKDSVESIGKDLVSLESFKNDGLVRVSATAQMNIEKTRQLLGEVKTFGKKYSKLIKEIKNRTESASAASLLSLYKEIKGLLGLKTTTPEISEKISILEKNFEILILTIIDALPEIIETEGAVSYAKAVKISIEESPNELDGTKDNRSIIEENTGSAGGKDVLSCNIDRNRIFEVFLDSVVRRFTENLHNTNLIGKDDLSFILSDLVRLKETDGLAIPSKYKIFSFATIQYHRMLYEYLEANTDKFDPNESIGILLWCKKYYAEMEKMGRMKSALGPVLFAGREGDLVDKYISAAQEKLSEWIHNLANMESKRFQERKKAPDLDGDSKFISIGFMDLLHIIRQQLEPMHVHPGIFKRVSAHILKCVEEFREILMEAVITELDLVLKDKAHNGFEEYCIALSNSGLKFMDCLHTLPFYNDPNMQSISKVFYACMEQSNDALIRNILYVVSPATENIFTEKWISEPVTQTIISTYADYLTDYKESMIDYTFTSFVSALLDSTIELYFDRLTKKRTVYRKEHLSIITMDRKKYREFFSKYLSKNSLKESLRRMDYFISITSSDNISLCTSEVKLYLKDFPDCSKEALIKILRKMPGGSKEFSKEVMSRI